jgi:hypothetical protein
MLKYIEDKKSTTRHMLCLCRKNILYKMKVSNVTYALFFLIYAILPLSCNSFQGKRQNSGNKIVFNITAARELGISESKRLKKEYIEFSSDSILIPAYSNLILENENFIIFSNTTNQIFRFANNGDFINFTGKRGNGPGEFAEMRDVGYNTGKNQIEVLDNNAILKYSPEGNFITKCDIPYPAFSFSSENDSYWFYLGNNISVSDYKLIRTDTNFVERNNYLPARENGLPIIENNFNKSEYLTFRESFNPDLYTMTGNELVNSYTIDFGKFTVADNLLDNQATLVEKLDNIEYCIARAYMENEKYIFLLVIKYTPQKSEPDLFYWIINKTNEEETVIHIKDFIEESYLLYPQILSDDDVIYFLGYDISTGDETASYNSNPKIIKIKVDEFFQI